MKKYVGRALCKFPGMSIDILFFFTQRLLGGWIRQLNAIYSSTGISPIISTNHRPQGLGKNLSTCFLNPHRTIHILVKFCLYHTVWWKRSWECVRKPIKTRICLSMFFPFGSILTSKSWHIQLSQEPETCLQFFSHWTMRNSLPWFVAWVPCALSMIVKETCLSPSHFMGITSYFTVRPELFPHLLVKIPS